VSGRVLWAHVQDHGLVLTGFQRGRGREVSHE
jgi:hypothetical protein